MEQIKQQFQELNSADQTKLICELINENNRFLNLKNILEELVEHMGYKEVEETARFISNSYMY